MLKKKQQKKKKKKPWLEYNFLCIGSYYNKCFFVCFFLSFFNHDKSLQIYFFCVKQTTTFWKMSKHNSIVFYNSLYIHNFMYFLWRNKKKINILFEKLVYFVR